MALNRDKFRKIVGGITTATDPQDTPAEEVSQPAAEAATPLPRQPPAGQGHDAGEDNGGSDQERAG